MGSSASSGLPASVDISKQALTKALGDDGLFQKVFGDLDRVNFEQAFAAIGVPAPAPRPPTAVGRFLRIVTVNDSYSLKNYSRVATAIRAARASEEAHGCVVRAFMNGDFLSPCVVTSLDGGQAMLEGLNACCFDYVCLGNHEFDLGIKHLAKKLRDCKPMVVNSNVNNPEFDFLPKFDTFEVGDRTVCVGGFLTGDKSIYAPTNCPKCTPVNEAILKAWGKVKSNMPAGKLPDLFLPMTHQLTSEDRSTGRTIDANSELKQRTPVLLAGHDHEVFIEDAGSSLIVKVGMDCEFIGLCDIWWTADGQIQRRVELVPATVFPPEPSMESLYKKTDEHVQSMMGVSIARLPTPMSSKKVRFEASDMASFLVSLIKKGLHSEGVEIALILGGAVRAGKDYEAGDFLMQDLFGELAFDCDQAIVMLPGHIIADSIMNSRSAEKPAPGFMHSDEDAVVTSDHVLTVVDGKPFDPDKLYTVCIQHVVLKGLNSIQPLYSYVQANIDVPDIEACQPAKNIVMRHCMRESWRKILHCEDWDVHHNGVISPEDLEAGIHKAMASLDTNGDGFIDKSEVQAFFEKEEGHRMSAPLLAKMMDVLDEDHNGCIVSADLRNLAH